MTDYQKRTYEDLLYTGALYSFKNDTVGANPTGFTTGEPAGTSVQVIASYLKHNKVVEITDASAANVAFMYNGFVARASGTMECLVAVADAAQYLYIQLKVGIDPVANYGVCVRIGEDFFQYYSGAWNNIVAALDATWYHVRITFECGAGAYDGLAADTFNIYINGTKYGPYAFRTAQATLDTLMFNTVSTTLLTAGYVNAVDYSWATGYTLNRNWLSMWDQITYPAVIEYLDEYTKTKNRIHEIAEHVLIQVDQGICDMVQYGQNTAALKETKDLIHIYLEIRNEQNSFLTNKQYLDTIKTALIAWYKARAYVDTELIGIYPVPGKPYRLDCWLRIYEVS